MPDEEIARLNQEIAQLSQAGEYERALTVAHRACDLTREVYGNEHPAVAEALHNLGELHRRKGDHIAAVPVYRQVLEIRRKTLSTEDPAIAESLIDLAMAHEDAGDVTAAIPLYQEALDIRRRVLPAGDRGIADCINNLALAHHRLGKAAVGLPLLREAYDILRKALGSTHPHVATNLSNQAALQQSLGNNAAAKVLLHEALGIRCKISPKQHPVIAQTLLDLAMIHFEMGDHATGLSLLNEALEVARNAESGHPRIASILGKLAALYHKMGDDVTSSRLLHEALHIKYKVFPADHPSIVNSLRDLAAFYFNIGNPPFAELYLRAALEIQTRNFPEGHPAINRNLSHLKIVYLAMGFSLSTIDKLLEPFGRTSASSVEQVRQNALRTSPQALSEATAVGPVPAGLGAGPPAIHDMPSGRVDAAYVEAEDTLLDKVLELAHRVTDPLSLADTMHGAALRYREIGRYLKALALLEETLRIRQKTLGPGDPSLITTQHDLGVLYCESGRYRDAEILLQEALEKKRVQKTLETKNGSFPDRSTLAVTLQSLALVYREFGRYKEALPLLEEALQIWQETLRSGDPLIITACSQLGMLYFKLGRHTDAETVLCRNLEIARRLVPGSRALATSLDHLASIFITNGRYADAILLLDEALRIRRRILPTLHPEIAATLNALAISYQALGRYADAEQLLHEALQAEDLVGPNPFVAEVLNNLAVLYREQGRLDEAINLAERAIQIARAAMGIQHPYVSIGLVTLAALYQAAGRARNAETLLRHVIEEYGEGAGDHLCLAATKNALAVLCEAQSRHAEAEQLYHDSLNIAQSVVGEDHYCCAIVLDNLAALLIRTGRVAEAIQRSFRASDIYDLIIDQIISVSSEQKKLSALRSVRIGFDILLTLLTKTESVTVMKAGLDIVLRRKGIIAESLIMQRDAILIGAHPELTEALRELMELRLEIAKLQLGGSASEGLKDRQQMVTGLIERREKLEVELSRRCPETSLSPHLRTVDRERVLSKVPKEGTLVEFVKFNRLSFTEELNASLREPGYLAFVLVPGEPCGVTMIDLGEAEPIDRAIAAFRSAIGGGGRHIGPRQPHRPIEEIDARGTELRKLVFDPLLSHLGGRTRLFLAADGELTRLPFEVLPMAEGRRVIDDYMISYLGSGRDLLRFGVGSSSEPIEPLVAAGPDFDLAGLPAPASETRSAPGQRSRDLHRGGDGLLMHFDKLKGAEEEGRQIATMLGVEPKLGAEVLEATIKAHHSPCILHLSTHGGFLPDQPRDPNAERLGLSVAPLESFDRGLHLSRLENPLLRSFLALAGANTWLRGGTLPEAAEDGMLNAEDVSGLDLLGTELVVLSACETALGSVQIGEGVFGLQRAFVLAGAKTLVMSQWEVPDAETRELMEGFYRRVLAGEGRAQALREAQLMLKAKHPDDPACWGAFICLGDPSPLPQRNSAEAIETTNAPTPST
jgi:tetratricopeptide (TPR) repeat protein